MQSSLISKSGMEQSKNKMLLDLFLGIACCGLYLNHIYATSHLNTYKLEQDMELQTIVNCVNQPNDTFCEPNIHGVNKSEEVAEGQVAGYPTQSILYKVFLSIIASIIFIRTILSIKKEVSSGSDIFDHLTDPSVAIDLTTSCLAIVSLLVPPLNHVTPLFLQSFNARNAIILLTLKFREDPNATFYSKTFRMKLWEIVAFTDTLCILFLAISLQHFIEVLCVGGHNLEVALSFHSWADTILKEGIIYTFNPFAYFGRFSLFSSFILATALPEIKRKAKSLT